MNSSRGKQSYSVAGHFRHSNSTQLLSWQSSYMNASHTLSLSKTVWREFSENKLCALIELFAPVQNGCWPKSVRLHCIDPPLSLHIFFFAILSIFWLWLTNSEHLIVSYTWLCKSKGVKLLLLTAVSADAFTAFGTCRSKCHSINMEIKNFHSEIASIFLKYLQRNSKSLTKQMDNWMSC